MLKKFVLAATLTNCLTAASWANADNNCMDVSLDPARESGLLRPTTLDECNAVWDTLNASQKFPHIFRPEQTNLYPGLCYVSTGNGIAAKLGSRAVNVKSVSAWTTDFVPILIGGNDVVASVITQWTVFNVKNSKLGKVFTSDAIDLSSSSELDVMVGGSDQFENAKGAVRIDSTPVPNPLGEGLPPLIKVTGIKGKLCLP